MFDVELSIFCPPIPTCKLVWDNGDIVAGQVSNGDFHWKSPNPLLNPVAPINGQMRTAVGWTIVNKWKCKSKGRSMFFIKKEKQILIVSKI